MGSYRRNSSPWLSPLERLDMQPKGFSEGRFIDISEENGVTKRMKMSHRK